MESEKEFETRNRLDMGNKTEFKTGNGRKWETIQYKKHFLTKKNKKKQENIGTIL